MRRSMVSLAGATCLWTVAGLALTPSAHAHTVWTSGVKVGDNFTYDLGPIYSYPENGQPCKSGATNAVVAVKFAGDYVYVYDSCADGKSAVARITGHEDGHWHTRICRNSHGHRTWARCNYDWPEAPEKWAAAGVYDADTDHLFIYNGTAANFSNN